MRWRKSGLGSAEYAAEHGLDRTRLLWWSSQLGRRIVERDAQLPSAASAAAMGFVPLRVREDGVAGGTAEASPSSYGHIEVILNNGRRVRITGSVDAAELARVVDAVEGGRRC